jgi:hypothetical protein
MFCSCVTEQEKSGIIVEKAAGYDMSTRNFEYKTIVKCDDGYIREVKGIRVYSYPIGTRINFTVYK